VSETYEHPDTEDVTQEEPEPHEAVKVAVEGPVRTQALPPRGRPVMRTEGTADSPLSQTVAAHILDRDLRRARAVLTAVGGAVVLGTAKTDVQAGVGFTLPSGASLEVRHAEDVYAKASAGATTLAVLAEFWAD
jgi:hypothetical protein